MRVRYLGHKMDYIDRLQAVYHFNYRRISLKQLRVAIKEKRNRELAAGGRNDDELKAATEAWFGKQTDDFYFKGIDYFKRKEDEML